MTKHRKVLKTKTYQYVALGDGVKRTFYNHDGLKDYPNNFIRDPKKMSYINLFINGVLQPQKNYRIQKGILQLNTADAPPMGAPVILQFIQICLVWKTKSRKINRFSPSIELEEE